MNNTRMRVGYNLALKAPALQTAVKLR